MNWRQGYGNETALHIIASQLVNPWLNARRYDTQWTEMDQARAMWEWCDYPDEFTANPEAGMLASMALPEYVNQPNPPFPTRVPYTSHVSHPNFFDPIVIASDDPNLHHYMAAWAQSGLSYSTAVDILRDIDQAIELGDDNPHAHRIKAETHLAWALGRNPVLRPDNEARQPWIEHHYNQAVDAYSTYESLADTITVGSGQILLCTGQSTRPDGTKAGGSIRLPAGVPARIWRRVRERGSHGTQSVKGLNRPPTCAPELV